MINCPQANNLSTKFKASANIRVAVYLALRNLFKKMITSVEVRISCLQVRWWYCHDCPSLIFAVELSRLHYTTAPWNQLPQTRRASNCSKNVANITRAVDPALRNLFERDITSDVREIECSVTMADFDTVLL